MKKSDFLQRSAGVVGVNAVLTIVVALVYHLGIANLKLSGDKSRFAHGNDSEIAFETINVTLKSFASFRRHFLDLTKARRVLKALTFSSFKFSL